MKMNLKNVTGLWLAFVFGAVLPMQSPAQMADCIAAEVGNKTITLSDLRIILAFGLEDGEAGGGEPATLTSVLERTIDRKVVLELTQEKMPIRPEEADTFLENLARSLGREEVRRRLEEFGLDWSDLRAYVEEKLVFEKIISMRFSQSAAVSLKEMEAYYIQTYLPAQQKLGQPVRPMMQILNEIEQKIREEKTRTQVSSWISNLRKQAEIRINADCLKDQGRERPEWP
jgi:hypothetical protein